MNIIRNPWKDIRPVGVNDDILTGIAVVLLGILVTAKDDRKVW